MTKAEIEPSAFRQEPFRLFFPLGIVLALWGVGQWLFLALAVREEYRSIFHSMVQVQGFLACFAVGFLFTMLPRRTATAPAAGWEIVVAAVCPTATAIFAWYERWAAAQACWIVLLVLLLRFITKRIGRQAGRRPPSSFVWLPVAIGFGLLGALLTGGASAMGDASGWVMHELGRAMVLQGTFVALVLGVGGLAIPLMTRSEPPPDSGSSPVHRRERWLHLTAAGFLLASFVIEAYGSLRLGLWTRGAVILVVEVVGTGLVRRPSRPGLNRWLIWVAAWCLPLGYLLAGSVLEIYKGALHVAFIGGFALLVMSVSTQVILGHGGYEALRDGRPPPLMIMAASLAVAVLARILMEVQEERLLLWMLVAAVSFMCAATSWLVLLLPRLRPSAS